MKMKTREEIYQTIKEVLPVSKTAAIVVAPTGSGKSTAAIKLISQYFTKHRFIFLTPIKATVYEFHKKLVETIGPQFVLRDDSDVKVESTVTPSDWLKYPVIISTYERAVNVISKLPTILSGNTILIIDEFHNITDKDRAFAIEALLAMAVKSGTRLILLSATFPEVSNIEEYLKEHGYRIVKFEKGERPVEIIPVAVSSFVDTSNYCGPLGKRPYKGLSNDYYNRIYRDVLKYNEKTECYESTGEKVIDFILKQPKPIVIFIPNKARAHQLAVELNRMGYKAVEFHASLPPRVRKAIQDFMLAKVRGMRDTRALEVVKKELRYFDGDDIEIIVSTHSLAQGVNMPIETVAIPYLHMLGRNKVMPEKPSMIIQMAGRAGRFSGHGKAIVVYDPFIEGSIINIPFENEKKLVEAAIEGMYERVSVPSMKFSVALYILSRTFFGSIEDLLRNWYPNDERLKELEYVIEQSRPYIEALPLVDENNKLTWIGQKISTTLDTETLKVAMGILKAIREGVEEPMSVVTAALMFDDYIVRDLGFKIREMDNVTTKVNEVLATLAQGLPKLGDYFEKMKAESLDGAYKMLNSTSIPINVFGTPFETAIVMPPQYENVSAEDLVEVLWDIWLADGLPTTSLVHALNTLNLASDVVKFYVIGRRGGLEPTEGSVFENISEDELARMERVLSKAKAIMKKIFKNNSDHIRRGFAVYEMYAPVREKTQKTARGQRY